MAVGGQVSMPTRQTVNQDRDVVERKRDHTS